VTQSHFSKELATLFKFRTCPFVLQPRLYLYMTSRIYLVKQWRIYCKSNDWIYIEAVRHKLDFRSTFYAVWHIWS